MLYHQFLCCDCSKLFRCGEMFPFERPVLCFAYVSRLYDRSSREVVKLQRINIVVAVCQKRQSSGMIFQDASVLVCKRGIQATFKTLCIMSKSVILSPTCFLSPIVVDFLYLCGFSIPNKVEN